jgi:beta-lactamase regulating signal transducer with metallopeptidase domain
MFSLADLAPDGLAALCRTILGCLLTITLLSLPPLAAAVVLAPSLRKRSRTDLASVLPRIALTLQALLCLGSFFLSAYSVSAHRTESAPAQNASVHGGRITLSPLRRVREERPQDSGSAGRNPPDGATPSQETPAALPPAVFIALAGVWCMGSLALLFGLALSAAYLWRLHRTSATLPPGHPAYTLLKRACPHLTTPPRIKTSPAVTVPFAAGPPFAAQGIFLPARFNSLESPMHRESVTQAVLAHEAEHLQRRDPFWNALGRLLAALLWPNPLQWLLLREMDRVQERACDEKAVRAVSPGRPSTLSSEYAQCLLAFADLSSRESSGFRHVAAAAAAAPPSFIEERVQNIMSGKIHPAPIVGAGLRRALLAGAGLFAGGTLLLAGRTSPASLLPQVAEKSAPPRYFINPRVDIDVRNERIADVLKQMVTDCGMKLVIDPEAQETLQQSYITMKSSNQALGSAVQMALRMAQNGRRPLYFTINGDTVRIYRVKVDAAGLPVKTVSLDYGAPTPISVVLKRLFADTGFTFTIKPEFRQTVRVRVVDQPLDKALTKALQATSIPLKYSVRSGGLVEIGLVNPPPPVVTKDLTGKFLSSNFNDKDIREALSILLQQANCDYYIANEVQGTVTDHFENLPLGEALPRVLGKSEQPLEYVVQDGVVIVRPVQKK